MAFEVYESRGGIWYRVILEGSDGDTELVIKTGSDTMRVAVLEGSVITQRLSKTGADTFTPTLVETATIVSSGTALKPGVDTITPRIVESAIINVAIDATDIITIRTLEASGFTNYGASYPGEFTYPGVTLFPGELFNGGTGEFDSVDFDFNDFE